MLMVSDVVVSVRWVLRRSSSIAFLIDFWIELYEHSRRMLRLTEACDRCPVHREAKSRVSQYAWQSFHNAGTILEQTLAGMRHRDFQGCDTPANSLQYHH
jgi:hypothetical protein